MPANGYDRDAANAIIERYGAKPELLVQILRAMLVEFRAIPVEAERHLAEALNLSRADVHGVVSFYHDFRRTPPGRHVVKICQAEACQAMGGRRLTEHARQALGIDFHETANDVTLEPVYCLGNCALTPSVMIDEKTYGRVTNERFDALIGALSGDER